MELSNHFVVLGFKFHKLTKLKGKQTKNFHEDFMTNHFRKQIPGRSCTSRF